MPDGSVTFVDRFLRPDVVRGPEERFGARLLVVTLLVALTSFSSFSVLQTQAGNVGLAALQGAAAIVCVTLLALLRRARRTAAISHALCVLVTAQITMISVLYGGVELPALAFFSVSPLVALMTVGRRAAWAWLVIGIAVILALNVLQETGFPFPAAPPPNRWVNAASLAL